MKKLDRIPDWLFNGGIFAYLLWISSCAPELLARPVAPGAPVTPSAGRSIPGDVPLNPDAGRGGLVIARIGLANGQTFPFIVDTGSDCTLLDKSLESKLGKSVGMDSNQLAGIPCRFDFHKAPDLYLGGARLLMTGPFVGCTDLKPLSALIGCRVMGILGMDVLEHYCIQLDFAAGKMRFLDDAHADRITWGRPFPIVPLLTNDSRPAVAQNLLGLQGPHSLIDSGFLGDGSLMPGYFQRWTNAAWVHTNGEAHSPDGVFGGEKYPWLFLSENDWPSDGIGLNFLARHRVTFDFPNHTLYLQRQSAGPLRNLRMARLKPIPDKEPKVTAHLRAVVQDCLDDTECADDYTAAAWKDLSLIKRKSIQATARQVGALVSLALVERRGGMLGLRRSYCYRLEFTKATVLVQFVFQGRTRLASVHSESVEWREPLWTGDGADRPGP